MYAWTQHVGEIYLACVAKTNCIQCSNIYANGEYAYCRTDMTNSINLPSQSPRIIIFVFFIVPKPFILFQQFIEKRHLNNIDESPYYKYTLSVFCSPALQHTQCNLAVWDTSPWCSRRCSCYRRSCRWRSSIPRRRGLSCCTCWWCPRWQRTVCNRKDDNRPRDHLPYLTTIWMREGVLAAKKH